MAKKGKDRPETRGEVMRLRLTRRPVADLTEKQMEDAVGGHVCPTEEATCPQTCGNKYTCPDFDTCGRQDSCEYTMCEGCRPDTVDSCETHCEFGC